MQARRRGSIFGPLLLIGAGVIFLLNNLGVLDWSIWRSLISLWPLLLVAAGLDLLVGRRSALGGVFVALFMIVLLVGGVWWLSTQTAGADLTSHTIRQSLQGAASAQIEISAGAGHLTLGPLAEGGSLIEGAVALPTNQSLREDFRLEGNVAHYELRGGSVNWVTPRFERETWDLRLSRDLPLDLRVNTGLGESTLDLERLRLSALDVGVGVGDMVLHLPGQGRYTARINGGIGNVRVRVPAGLAARINVDGGLGNVTVRGDYQRRDDTWTSPAYESADNSIRLEIDGGVGSITVEPLNGNESLPGNRLN